MGDGGSGVRAVSAYWSRWEGKSHRHRGAQYARGPSALRVQGSSSGTPPTHTPSIGDKLQWEAPAYADREAQGVWGRV